MGLHHFSQFGCFCIDLYMSRHSVVCRAAQEAGAPHREYIYRKKENVIFTFLYLGDPLSDWKQICYRISRQPGKFTFQIRRKSIQPFPRYELSKFQFFSCFFFLFFVFSHTCKNCYKTQACTPIALKFGTQKGSPKANPSIRYGAYPMNGSGVMTNYLRKTRSICCHAYRVNRFMELVENCYVDGVTIVGVPFGGLKGIEIKTMEI